MNKTHILLLIGIALVIISFLFFGRHQPIYETLLFSGLALSLFFYLVILFSKKNWRLKLFWTIVIICGAVLQQVLEPFLIKSSYLIYIKQHEKLLTEVNNILKHTQSDVTIMEDRIILKYDVFPIPDREKLLQAKRELGVCSIVKMDRDIYYEFGGFLDERIGITYWTEKSYPDISYRHITGDWFH